MHKNFLIAASLLLALAVVLGAFGAHGLRQILPGESLNTFETGVRYHFYHAFALLATGIIYANNKTRRTIYAGYCFLGGIVLFSGSLYLLTMLKATQTVGLTGIGMITPVGGLLFVIGWLLLTASFWNRNAGD